MAVGPFSVPLELLHLHPDETLEVEVAGPTATWDQLELGRELKAIPALEATLVERKAIDIPQLIYLAGAAGGVLQGIDVIARWLKAKRDSKHAVRITITTTKGTVELDAANIAAARDLASKLKDATKKTK